MADQQVDLLLDSLVGVPLKDDRALMEFPFFGLQKQPRMEPVMYDDGRTQIKIEPGPKGLATIWDKEGSRHRKGSWSVLVIMRPSPHGTGEPDLLLAAGPGHGPARTLGH